MKKVLILTYYWPPGSGPGVQRWLKFCKYLPEFGWEPIVVTVKNGSYPSMDESLLEEVPEGMHVVRTASIEPFALYNALRGKKGKSVEVGMGNIKGNQSWFGRLANFIRANLFVPDARIGWNVYSLPEALRIIQKEKPAVLITTGPPHSTHLVGERLQRSEGIKWIADLRDPWTNIYYNAYLNRTKKSIRRDQELENLVVSSADGIMVASPGLQREFESRSKQIEFVPNGYDQSDFLSLVQSRADRFTLAYVGNLKAAQNTEVLWKAIAVLCHENASFAKGFRLSITGNVSEEIQSSIDEAGIRNAVTIEPFVPHREAIDRMHAAHVLLLPIPQQEGNEVILTGKLFEYLATRRPILSLGPVNGNASEILKACEKDQMLNYDDLEGIKTLLQSYFEEYQTHPAPLVTGNDSFKQYSRKGTTEDLANYLNTVTR